jgi:ABC-type Na+ transport system ATPase subunit NatA
MIEVKNISKSYGEKNQKILAVDNSFSVEKGEILG